MAEIRVVRESESSKELRKDLLALLKKHAGEFPADEFLAIACNLVGKILALQDYSRFSEEDLSQLMNANILLGKQQMLSSLERSPPSTEVLQ